ncbi:MAG: hypothetical protein AAGJ74_11010 [Pseudomonadota bacterium]
MISPLGPAAAPSVAPSAPSEVRDALTIRLDAAPTAAETPAAPTAASGRTDTAIAISPTQATTATDGGVDAGRPSFLPPNPDAPTGPPPAFEASLLDRERELGVGPQDVVETRAPETGTAALNPASEPVVAPEADDGSGPIQSERSARALYDVPPEPAARAEDSVATLRRIETPYDTATVDVAR